MGFPCEELRAHREALGLSQAEAAAAVHIPLSFIDAIELGEWHKLPPLTYSVSFLRSYCECLGLEPERYATALRAMLRPANTQRIITMKGTRPQLQLAGAPAWVADLAAWAAVIGVFAGAWLAYTLVVRPDARMMNEGVKAEHREMTLPPAPGELDSAPGRRR